MKENQKTLNLNNLKSNGIFWMILASLFFALMGATVKELTQRLPSIEVVFFRFLFNFILVIPWMIHQKISFSGNNKAWLLVRSIAGFMSGALSFYVTSKIMLADAYILYHTSVLFVAILSIFFLKETLSIALSIFILMALVGSAFILKPELGLVSIPGLLALLSALLAAVAYIAIKKLHETDHYFTIVFQYSLLSLLASLLFMQTFIVPTMREAILLLACGVFGTVAQILLTYSYKHTLASVVTPYSYSTVLFSTLIGALIWNEIPDQWSLLGGALIIISGIGIIQLRNKR